MIPFQPFFQAQDSTNSVKALSQLAAPHLPQQWLPRAPWRATHTSWWSISPRTGLGCRNTVTVSTRQMEVLPSQLKPGQHNPAEPAQKLSQILNLYLEKPWSVKLFKVLLYYEAFFLIMKALLVHYSQHCRSFDIIHVLFLHFSITGICQDAVHHFYNVKGFMLGKPI